MIFYMNKRNLLKLALSKKEKLINIKSKSKLIK